MKAVIFGATGMGPAMIQVAKEGASKQVLESRDIIRII